MNECNLNELLEKTRAAVKESGQTLDEIAAGAGLTYHWVAKFSQGVLANPTVKHLSKLHEYLNNTNTH